VFITLSASDIREMAMMIKAHVEAYIQMEHIRKMWSYEPIMNQQQGQGNYNQQQHQQPQAQQGSQGYQQQGQQNQGNYVTQQPSLPQNFQQQYQQQQQGYQGQQVPFPDPSTDNLPF